MKKTISILAILLCFSSLFALHFYVGPSVEYRPFHPELSNPDNIFRPDSYFLGAEASVETKFFVADADMVFNSLKKDSFCIENNFYSSFNIPICKLYNLSFGFGIRTNIEKAATTDKLYFTIGGVKPSDVIKAVKNRPELLLQLVQLKVDSRFYINNEFELDLAYKVQPSRIGKELVGGSVKTVVDSGIVSLAFKYKIF